MPRWIVSGFASVIVGALAIAAVAQIGGSPSIVTADVGGVAANAPTFSQGQPLTLTVSAEDDDGTLTIISHLPGSHLTVTNCTGIGSKIAGRCDANGTSAVNGQESTYITINTNSLDQDEESELLYVTLTLEANCDDITVVTISANQPGNVGPDDVTVNCVPPTPSPTPSPTPTQTSTPTQTPAPTHTATPGPAPTHTPTPIPSNAILTSPPPTFAPPPPPVPPAQFISSVLTIPIIPPNTGDAGLIAS